LVADVSRADASRAFKRCQLGPERIFHLPRVGCSQTVLGAKDPMCPNGGFVR
jgi:hypothetical protein